MSTFAIAEDDLVVGTVSGDGMPGVPIPPALLGVDPKALRLVNGALVDASTLGTFYIDARGQKHAVAREDRQRLACRLGDQLVRDGDTWRTQTSAEKRAPDLNAECTRRIYAVLSDNTQKNLTAYGADLALETRDLTPDQTADVAAMRAARGWVQDMLAACRAAIASGAEPAWPPVPDGVAALAERF